MEQEQQIRKGKLTRLKIVLLEKGITQKELTQRADLEFSQVSRIVSGKQENLLMSNAKKICKALGCTLDEAFGDL